MRKITVILVLLTAIIFSCNENEQTEDVVMNASNQIIENYEAFSKLYGYVKYFYPGDEVVDIDWNKFAYHGAKIVKGAENNEALVQILNDLFLPIAPGLTVYLKDNKPEKLNFITGDIDKNAEPVFWQHLGLGDMQAVKPFQSIRVNSLNEIPVSDKGYATAYQDIDANNLKGKIVKFSASIKTNLNGCGNHVQLFVKTISKNGQVGVYNDMKYNPIKSKEWKRFEILSNIDELAEKVCIGLVFNGLGSVYVDDIEMLVQDGENWTKVDLIKNAGFEALDENQNPKNWICNDLGYNYTLSSDEKTEGSMSLMMESVLDKRTEPLFANTLTAGEIIEKNITENIMINMPISLPKSYKPAQSNEEAYNILKADLDNIDFDNVKGNDEYLRIANTLIMWNVINHFYPYNDNLNIDWDKQLISSLKEAIDNKNKKDFFYTLQHMLEKLNDGGISVDYKTLKDVAGLPVKVVMVDNNVVVSASEDDMIKIGDIIVSMDDIEAKKVLENESNYISGTPQWKQQKALEQFTNAYVGAVAKIEIKREDSVFTIEVARKYIGKVKDNKLLPFDIIENMAYINLCKVSIENIKANISKIEKSKGIIVDLRGKMMRDNLLFINHLVDKKIDAIEWLIPQILYPDFEKLAGWNNAYTWTIEPAQPRLNKPVVFLIDANTIGLSQCVAQIVQSEKIGTLVGKSTSGVTGYENQVFLPGGYKVLFTGAKTNSEKYNQAVNPDKEVIFNIENIKMQKDAYIDEAKKLINNPL